MSFAEADEQSDIELPHGVESGCLYWSAISSSRNGISNADLANTFKMTNTPPLPLALAPAFPLPPHR